MGKVVDVIGVVCKGVVDGKKYIIEVLLIKFNFIFYFVNGLGGGVKVMMWLAVLGIGVIVGGVVRIVLELVGV